MGPILAFQLHITAQQIIIIGNCKFSSITGCGRSYNVVLGHSEFWENTWRQTKSIPLSSFHHSMLCCMSHLVIQVSDVYEHRLICQASKVYYIFCFRWCIRLSVFSISSMSNSPNLSVLLKQLENDSNSKKHCQCWKYL